MKLIILVSFILASCGQSTKIDSGKGQDSQRISQKPGVADATTKDNKVIVPSPDQDPPTEKVNASIACNACNGYFNPLLIGIDVTQQTISDAFLAEGNSPGYCAAIIPTQESQGQTVSGLFNCPCSCAGQTISGIKIADEIKPWSDEYLKTGSVAYVANQ